MSHYIKDYRLLNQENKMKKAVKDSKEWLGDNWKKTFANFKAAVETGECKNWETWTFYLGFTGIQYYTPCEAIAKELGVWHIVKPSKELLATWAKENAEKKLQEPA